MKQQNQLLLTALLFLSLTTKAQKQEPVLFLKSGNLKTAHNITEASVKDFNRKVVRHRDKGFAMLQFEKLPTAEIRAHLSKHGVELLEYIPANAYTVSIRGNLTTSLLKKVGARTILLPTPEQKMHTALANGKIPDWANKVIGKVDVWVSFPKTYKAGEVIQFLQEKKMEILSTEHREYRILEVRVSSKLLQELASFPFIEYVQPVPPPVQPLNLNSRNASRAGLLIASSFDGGKGLNGEGVVVGIGDNGSIQSHTDLSGPRLFDRLSELHFPAIHAIHVSSTVAGAGIVNELNKGYATKASIINDHTLNIIYNAGEFVQNNGMVLTNNSYGSGGARCGDYGQYDYHSRMLDQQAFDYPFLQHVIAAGNDGNVNCNTNPVGFNTVMGSLQAAKNAVTVGSTDWTGALSGSSSKGPVKDGRLKPEITAQGVNVRSGSLNNGYTSSSGTSMAAPAVTGGLALLYQRYRQMNGGVNPKNGLMKALLCNGSYDLGNAGPDYSYGFGWMHLLRSVEMLEKEQYKIGSITNGGFQQYTITVPQNTAQVKVMLYWNDPPASLLSSQALVNDLDLTVADPSQSINLPRVLDPTVEGVLNPATTGVDRINNMEQVVIENPIPGNYTINITGMVAENPSQEFFVVYDIIPVSVTLTNPAGGQSVVPGETVQVNWDAYGEPTATFKLEYSLDNGASWALINSSISAAVRRYEWVVPNNPVSQALVRIERNGTGLSHTSQPFNILGVPSLSLSSAQCEGYTALSWTTVPGATDYELMMKKGDEMVTIATTFSTSFIVSELSRDSVYWFSVRARNNGKPGRRAVAVSRRPNSGTCTGSISDYDLKLDAIASDIVGRKHTSTELSDNYKVTLRIKNLDDVPSSSYTVSYKLNSNDWVSEQVSVPIPGVSIYNHTFSKAEDLSALGSYTLLAAVAAHAPDKVKSNDTLFTILRQLDNQAINLMYPFIDSFKNASVTEYTKDTMGLAGIDRYDFADNSSYGSLNINVNSFDGSKSLYFNPKIITSTSSGLQSVTGTYNLQGYDANVNDVRLSFKGFLSFEPNPENKLWVRGSDEQDWIELLDFKQFTFRDYSFMNIELSDSLLKYGQNFSSSFQLRWRKSPGEKSFAISNISLYEAFDDMQMLTINDVVNQSCGGKPLVVTIRNSSNNELSSVPVRYHIEGGKWITENIATVPPNTTIQYTFRTPLNFTKPGSYIVNVVTDMPTDNLRANDTLSTLVNYAPLVNTFPYLQNFENGAGGWYTLGTRPAWNFVEPSSEDTRKAASGKKAWKTSVPYDRDDWESYLLYSPCFEIGGMTNPTLSFSMAVDLGGVSDTTFDGGWIEYSTDNENWEHLVDVAYSVNWYNFDGALWADKKKPWHVVTAALPKNVGVIRLRFVKETHPDLPTEGIAIDDIHIYDRIQEIYDGSSLGQTATKAVSGNDWVHFENGGKLLASINPNGQNLGTTEVKGYIHSGPVRATDQQYFLNRNITIKPQHSTLTDSVTVRLYFLDSEVEKLIGATGCSDCENLYSAYDLGISKYSDPDVTKENGDLCDNAMANNWSFILNKDVAIVPFQNGYYAEFKVKAFSEFWLNSGGADKESSLGKVDLPVMNPVLVSAPNFSLMTSPAGGTWRGPGVIGNVFHSSVAGAGTHALTYTFKNSEGCQITAITSITVLPLNERVFNFTAEKKDRDAIIKWSTEMETTIVSYEVEVSGGESDLHANRFTKIGAVSARGGLAAVENYAFTDTTIDKFGTRKYRLKMIHSDGSSTYSQEVSLQFPDANTGVVYPNPSRGLFQLFVKISIGEVLLGNIYDSKGMLVKKLRSNGNGGVHKLVINLSSSSYPSGIYLLQTMVNGKRQTFKLHKL